MAAAGAGAVGRYQANLMSLNCAVGAWPGVVRFTLSKNKRSAAQEC